MRRVARAAHKATRREAGVTTRAPKERALEYDGVARGEPRTQAPRPRLYKNEVGRLHRAGVGRHNRGVRGPEHEK